MKICWVCNKEISCANWNYKSNTCRACYGKIRYRANNGILDKNEAILRRQLTMLRDKYRRLYAEHKYLKRLIDYINKITDK